MGSRTEEDRVAFNTDASNDSASSPAVSASQLSARSRSLDRSPQFVSPPHQNISSVTPAEGQNTLNRWSRLTDSSSHIHCRSKSSNRPTSIDGASSFVDSPPRKRQEKTGSPSSLNKINRDSTYSSTILRHIDTLSSLQISVNNSWSPPIRPTKSSSIYHTPSETARTVNGSDRPWDDFTSEPQDFSHKKTRDVTVGISSSLGLGEGEIDAVHLQGERPRPKDQATKHRSQTTGIARTPGSGRSNKKNSQKAMLSKALQKAKTAVLLDNAQNSKGAMQAYSEACALLQEVMYRSSGDEDRRKLHAIRDTYINRVNELEKTALYIGEEDNILPKFPYDQSQKDQSRVLPVGSGTPASAVNDYSYLSEAEENQSRLASQPLQSREPLLSSAPSQSKGRQYSGLHSNTRTGAMKISLGRPMDTSYMPLSPRKPQSPVNQRTPGNNNRQKQSADLTIFHGAESSTVEGHARVPSNESISWLDTIGEPGGSTTSSIHSRTSKGIRRKHIRASSSATEAEFDAALDAAVEAAYDDGFMPIDAPEAASFEFDREDRELVYEEDDVILANVRKRVELAKERVRQSEREHAIQAADDCERRRMQKKQQRTNANNTQAANESDEEEQLLEDITRGYMMDDDESISYSVSTFPRESDSSGFSGRTLNNSIGLNPTTSGTSLSAVSEKYAIPQLFSLSSKTKSAAQSIQVQSSLPPLQNTCVSLPLTSTSQGVRGRRLSGQNAKQLKIETATTQIMTGKVTSTTKPTNLMPSDTVVSAQTTTAGPSQPRQDMNYQPERPRILHSNRQEFSQFLGTCLLESPTPLTPNFTQPLTNDSDVQLLRTGSPAYAQPRGGPRKKFSSSSLKNLKDRNLSVSNIEDGCSDASLNTPMSSQFNSRDSNKGLPAMPALPTPIAMAFNEKQSSAQTGGVHLFTNDLLTPLTPGMSDSLGVVALEPCPTECLLRPFWLMRALYQTIANPCGGFISNKLFVPRNVWEIKGVKIKNVEDKISNCDYLTVALLKLSQVDTFDADAVLDEMQLLESVLEQVQVILAKKLGNDVGAQGSGAIFKDASIGADVENSNASFKSSSTTKSSFSWRRLRAKNSGAGLSNAYSNRTTEGQREDFSTATLPMTSNSITKVRFAKREVSQIQFTGPNASYMGALARLFDAAQIIDQIARQVEDPGLKHVDKTQVGLELSTRHAAEFFGFYICRFVLTDVGILLDKYIKKSTEWVLI